MRIFVAGASGVIGRSLVPLLVADGHMVAGMTRSEAGAAIVRRLGAEPVICDAFDADAVRAAVAGFGPDAIVDELTDLPDDASQIRELGARNSRIRREGTRNLLAAAEAAGVTRFICQSVAWTIQGDGGAAVAEMERAVLDARGVVVRYGQLYGPGTYHEGALPDPPRVHVAEAAGLTVPLLDAPSGIVTVTDEPGEDGPAPA